MVRPSLWLVMASSLWGHHGFQPGSRAAPSEFMRRLVRGFPQVGQRDVVAVFGSSSTAARGYVTARTGARLRRGPCGRPQSSGRFAPTLQARLVPCRGGPSACYRAVVGADSITPRISRTRHTSSRSSSTSTHTPAERGNTTWSPGATGILKSARSGGPSPTASTIPSLGGRSCVPCGTSNPDLRIRSGSSSLITTWSNSGRRTSGMPATIRGVLAITHFTDPACPFAFSSEPVRWRLRWQYGDQLRWRLRMIVLTLEEGEGEKLAEGAPTLQRRFGMPIDPAPYPRSASSEPACRAVVAARLRAPRSEGRLLRRLRVRTMLGGLLDDPG